MEKAKFKINSQKSAFAAFVILIIASIFLFKIKKTAISPAVQKTEEINSVEINGKTFSVEIADDEKERARGLGERSSLCGDCAMLFVFPQKGKYSFWMKDMKFPLDIIWINDGRVVYLARDIQPDSKEIISPDVTADRVIEINSGS